MEGKMDRASQLPGAVEMAGAFAEALDGLVTASAGTRRAEP
jgi:hypothetical protein